MGFVPDISQQSFSLPFGAEIDFLLGREISVARIIKNPEIDIGLQIKDQKSKAVKQLERSYLYQLSDKQKISCLHLSPLKVCDSQKLGLKV